MDLQKPQSIWSLRIRGTWAHKTFTKKWKLSENDKSILVEIVEENHASLSEITAQMRDITLDDVSESTIRRALPVSGYFGRVGTRKPFVSEGNRQRRLDWALERSSWIKDWNYIIWSDESRYVLSSSKRRK